MKSLQIGRKCGASYSEESDWVVFIDAWKEVNYQQFIYTYNFRSLQVSLPTIQQASDEYNFRRVLILRTEDNWNWKCIPRRLSSRDLTLHAIFSSSRDFCVVCMNGKGNNGRKRQREPVLGQVKKKCFSSGRAVFFVIYYFLLHAFFTHYYLPPGIRWSS